MQAPQMMTSNPAVCTPDTRLPDVARLMVEHDCGEIPVVESTDSMRPVGVIPDRDITCRAVAEGKNPVEMTASECMATPCVTVAEEASVHDCCRTMEAHRIRRVPVVDSRGGCCGIVSQADIAETAGERRAAEVLKQVSQPTSEPSRVGGATEYRCWSGTAVQQVHQTVYGPARRQSGPTLALSGHDHSGNGMGSHHHAMMRDQHRKTLWVHVTTMALGAWLVSSHAIFNHQSGALAASDLASGAAIIVFAALPVFTNRGWPRWVNCFVV